MNDEGRWMINNNLTTEKTLPYFQDYVYTKALEESKAGIDKYPVKCKSRNSHRNRGNTMDKIVAVIAVIAALVSVGSGAWPFPNFGSTYSGRPESITIGTAPLELAALIFIAEDQGFFAGNGLNVTIKNYDTALASVAGMEKGNVDI